MNMTDITPRWLSVSQASRYASMSRTTIMQHIASGDFVAKKEGKWRIDRESIDRYQLAGVVNYREEARSILASMRSGRK